MSSSDVTCWTMIRAARSGSRAERESFARRYLPVIDAYLGARWRGSTYYQDLDDAVQEVFIECFRSGGALERLDSDRSDSFRAYLYGVVRNVALRIETRRVRKKSPHLAGEKDFDELRVDEPTLSQVFDRSWAKTLIKEAWAKHAEKVAAGDDQAKRRLELLKLRIEGGLPIRDIAARWQVDAQVVHSEYRSARREFKASLLEIVSFYRPGSPEEAEAECLELLQLIGNN